MSLRSSIRTVGDFIFRRRRVELEMEDEFRAHIAIRAEDLERQGLSRAQAERQARIEFGGFERYKEECREALGTRLLQELAQDLRYGLRQVRRNPGFTAVAVLTLALGIGATTVMFSVIDNVLLQPFPYKNASRYTAFSLVNLDRPGSRRGVLRIPEFLACEKQNNVFDSVMGYWPAEVLYKGTEGTLRLQVAYVTANTFHFLGMKPVRGRELTSEDGKPNSQPVAVMSYRLWQSQLGGNPKLLGSTLTLNGQPMTLVGVMPPRFRFAGADVWLPLKLSRGGAAVGEAKETRFVIPIGLRKRGVSLRTAASNLLLIFKRLSKILPVGYPKRWTVQAQTLTNSEVGHFKPLLYTLFAAVMLLLLIACANVANLMLTRATVREREMAIRAAIGASRSRLTRQLLVEGFLLALLGGTLGGLFAYGGIKCVVAFVPQGSIPPSADIVLNSTVLLFTLGISALTPFLFALVPGFHAVGANLNTQIREEGQTSGTRLLHGRLREILVVTELSLTIILLAGAGLMMRTFFALRQVDLGFNPERILRAEVASPHDPINATGRRSEQIEEILDRVRTIPGVTAASVAAGVPPGGGLYGKAVVRGQAPFRPRYAVFNLCGTGYFKTLNIPLIRGKLLSAGDIESARRVAVINKALAHDFFGGKDPVGQEIQFTLLNRRPDTPHNAFFEIIGIVGNEDGPRGSVVPEAFLPYTITTWGPRNLLVRTALDANSLALSIRRAVASVASDVALTNEESIQTLLNDSTYLQPRFALVTLTVFAGLGLVLAAIGIFGVMAYSVSRRTHEIGIRMAMGAEKRDVLRMVVGQGLKLVLIGVAIGVVGAFAVTRFLASLLYGVKPTDLVTFVAVSLILIAVALLACYIPARRAANIDPLEALRYE